MLTDFLGGQLFFWFYFGETKKNKKENKNKDVERNLNNKNIEIWAHIWNWPIRANYGVNQRTILDETRVLVHNKKLFIFIIFCDRFFIIRIKLNNFLCV